MLTYRRHARKIFEIYDRLMFGAIGQQSDVEALRVAAIDFAHQEGFNRSEQDVTVQRVVTALSGPLKRAFSDFNSTPVVARSVFAEVAEEQKDDVFYILEYDGDFSQRKNFAYLAGYEELSVKLKTGLKGLNTAKMTVDKGLAALKKIWDEAAASEADPDHIKEFVLEAALLERGTQHENRFRSLSSDEPPEE